MGMEFQEAFFLLVVIAFTLGKKSILKILPRSLLGREGGMEKQQQKKQASAPTPDRYNHRARPGNY